MPLILGFIFLALGVSLTLAWWSAALLAAMQVLLLFLLLLCGLILTLVGYSEMKAARQFHDITTSPEGDPVKETPE